MRGTLPFPNSLYGNFDGNCGSDLDCLEVCGKQGYKLNWQDGTDGGVNTAIRLGLKANKYSH